MLVQIVKQNARIFRKDGLKQFPEKLRTLAKFLDSNNIPEEFGCDEFDEKYFPLSLGVKGVVIDYFEEDKLILVS